MVLGGELMPFVGSWVGHGREDAINGGFFKVASYVYGVVIPCTQFHGQDVCGMVNYHVLSFRRMFSMRLIIQLGVRGLYVFRFGTIGVLLGLHVNVVPGRGFASVAYGLAVWFIYGLFWI